MDSTQFKLEISSIPDVLSEFEQGKMIILIDDADRENEGDLVIPTELLSTDSINFMMKYARGLICTSLPSETTTKLKLTPQTRVNNSLYSTAFTVSVDHIDVIGRGVTAQGRLHTNKKLIANDVSADEFISPGHVFPLKADVAGVIGRQGQTEGSLDLARIAGLLSFSL